jgi:hypothetical protein
LLEDNVKPRKPISRWKSDDFHGSYTLSASISEKKEKKKERKLEFL